VLLGSKGEVLNMGRQQRVVTSAQWRALVIRDGGCVIAGHDCPPEHCEAHHYKETWLNGGVTDVDDLALICSYGHHAVHEGGFHLYLNDDNHWVWRRPDGVEHIGRQRGDTHHGGLASSAAAILNGPRGPCDG
jgi:hypothetical protein